MGELREERGTSKEKAFFSFLRKDRLYRGELRLGLGLGLRLGLGLGGVGEG